MIEKYSPKPPKKGKTRLLNIFLTVLAVSMWMGRDKFDIPVETLVFISVLLVGTLAFSVKNGKMEDENYEMAKTLKEMREQKRSEDFYKENFYD